MTNDVYGASCSWIDLLPSEYISELKKRTIEQAWLEILHKIVVTNRDKYLVVKMYDLEESRVDRHQYNVRFMLNSAHERTYEIANLADMPTAYVVRSAIQELAYRIKRKIKWLLVG